MSSTHSVIGIMLNDGKVRAVACHFDGYVEGVGKMLLTHYTNKAKIYGLISLGSISVLAKMLDPHTCTKHTTAQPQKDVTIAYVRDGHEYLIEIGEFMGRDMYHQNAGCTFNYPEYIYLFEDDNWYVSIRKDMDSDEEVRLDWAEWTPFMLLDKVLLNPPKRR